MSSLESDSQYLRKVVDDAVIFSTTELQLLQDIKEIESFSQASFECFWHEVLKLKNFSLDEILFANLSKPIKGFMFMTHYFAAANSFFS